MPADERLHTAVERFPADLQTQLDLLSLEQLENLSIEALQFSTLEDLRHFVIRS